jgi:hypothetical protein
MAPVTFLPDNFVLPSCHIKFIKIRLAVFGVKYADRRTDTYVRVCFMHSLLLVFMEIQDTLPFSRTSAF